MKTLTFLAAICFTLFTSAAAARAAANWQSVTLLACGAPQAADDIAFNLVCFGYTHQQGHYTEYLLHFNDANVVSGLELTSTSARPTEAYPYTHHELMDDGSVVGVADFTYYVEDPTNLGDGESQATHMAVTMDSLPSYTVAVERDRRAWSVAGQILH